MIAASEQHEPGPCAAAGYRDRYEALTGVSLRKCPICHRGHTIPLRELQPWRLPQVSFLFADTS